MEVLQVHYGQQGLYQIQILTRQRLARPGWYQPNRIVAFASYRLDYAKHFATSIGAIFEAAPAGVTSYVYNGDLNGDGNTGNDLIYIPRNASEINLIDAGSYNKTTLNQELQPVQQQTQEHLHRYGHSLIISSTKIIISQIIKDSMRRQTQLFFLTSSILDVNVTQDVYFYTMKIKQKHTLRLTLDILNFGNLLNKYWGIVKTPSAANFLKFEGMSADGKTPLFSFPFADAGSQTPYVNSFSDNTSLTRSVNNSTQAASRWIMQFWHKIYV